MKKLLLVTAATLIAGPALAADLPRYDDTQQAYQGTSGMTWTGFYAGLNLGYGFAGDFHANLGTRLNEGSGVTGGIQAGYNMQLDPVVVGIEGSLNYAGISDSYQNTRAKLGFNGSITPRLGYVMGDFMPYIKAGLAVGNVSLKGYGASDWQTQVGWTVGLGAEYRVTQEISVRAEYNYTDLSRGDFDLGTIRGHAGFSGSDLKLGVNYHF